MSEPIEVEAEIVEESTAVAVVGPGDLRAGGIFAGIDIRTPDGYTQAITAAKNMLGLVEAVRKMTIQLTKASEWDSFGKTLDLSEAACERMMTILGADIEITSEEWEWDDQVWIDEAKQFLPDKSGHYGVRIKIRIDHRMFGSRDGIGLAHSADKFLGTKGDAKAKAIEDGAHPDRAEGRLLEDVSRHSIYQHAYTRAKGNAIRKLLGVKSIRQDQLTEYGIGEAAGSQVDFSGKDKDAEDHEARIRKAVDDEIVTREQCLAWLKANRGYKGMVVMDAPPELIKALSQQIRWNVGVVAAAGKKASSSKKDTADKKEPKAEAGGDDRKKLLNNLGTLAKEHDLSLGDLGPRARELEEGIPGPASASEATLKTLVKDLGSKAGLKRIKDAILDEAEEEKS